MLDVLAPSKPFLADTGDDVNENSIVVILRHGGFGELFMGDASKASEARLIAGEHARDPEASHVDDNKRALRANRCPVGWPRLTGDDDGETHMQPSGHRSAPSSLVDNAGVIPPCLLTLTNSASAYLRSLAATMQIPSGSV